MKKNLFSFIVFALVLTLAFPVLAAEFRDVPGHWAEKSIERWTDEEIINGYADHTFKPDDYISRAEFVTIITRIFEPTKLAEIGIYKDVAKSAWYFESMEKGVAMGAIQGDGASYLRPDDFITRQEAITILDRLFHYETPADDTKIDFSDSDEIADWAYEAVLTFIDKGFVNGYEDRTLRPTHNIARAEVVKILDKAIAKIITKSGTYDLSNVDGIVIVKAKDVTLTNADIDKLFVANDDVKDTTKAEDVNDKDIYVISEITKETVKQPSGRTSSSVPTLVINVDDASGDSAKYTITSNKDEVKIRSGIKVTVKVNGKDTSVKNMVFTSAKLDAFKKALAGVIENNLDVGRVLNTVDADYSEVAELDDWAQKAFNTLKLTEEESTLLHALKDGGVFTYYEVFEILGLDDARISEAAIEIMNGYDFDTALSMLKQI